MLEANGHVTVNEKVPSERFHRFVDEKIRDWMEEQNLASSGETGAVYEVAFFDEDSIGEVSCLVVIQQGEQLWRSWETADNPRMALYRSLTKLQEDNGEASDEEAGRSPNTSSNSTSH